MTRYVILGLLRDGSPSHGYALMKGYRERSGVPMATGGLYRELARLVGEGLVLAAERGREADPRRTPYAITEAGKAAFDAWLAAGPERFNLCCDDELTMRAIFLGEAPPEVAADIIADWRDELWALTKTLERARQLELRGAQGRGVGSVLPILLARRLKHAASDLVFLDDLRLALTNGAAARTRPPRDADAAKPPDDPRDGAGASDDWGDRAHASPSPRRSPGAEASGRLRT